MYIYRMPQIRQSLSCDLCTLIHYTMQPIKNVGE